MKTAINRKQDPTRTWGPIGRQNRPLFEAPFSQITFPALLIAQLYVLSSALARDNGQWENSPAHIRQWFEGLKQPDNPNASCCGEADAYEADLFEIDEDHYVAIVTDGKGEIPNGTKIPVPNQKLKWDAGNPTGHGIIFIGTHGQVYCYVLPGGV